MEDSRKPNSGRGSKFRGPAASGGAPALGGFRGGRRRARRGPVLVQPAEGGGACSFQPVPQLVRPG